MKILYIITKTEIGGAQTHVLQLIRAMKEKGHEVALTSFPGGWLEKKATEHGAVFYPNLYFSNSYNPFKLFKAIKEIRKAVATFSPDIVTCHSTAGGFFGRLAIRNKVPTIYTAHGWAFTDGVPFIKKIIAYMAENIVAPYTSKIICVSEFDRKLGLRYGIAPKNKLVTVYNGVEIPKDIAQVDSEPPTLVFVGRLTYQKDTALLAKAYGALPKQIRESCTLKIIGGGPEKGRLQNLITSLDLSRSIVLDEVKPEEIPAVLSSSDIFILLSRYEGFPMTIIEAMSVGLPIISSAVGGTPEQVDESCGILVHNSIDEVVHALDELITNKEKRVKMGIAAREKAYTKFGIQRFLNETEQVYQDAITISRKI